MDRAEIYRLAVDRFIVKAPDCRALNTVLLEEHVIFLVLTG